MCREKQLIPERLPELVSGYSKDDILNMDETGLFFCALPDKGFTKRVAVAKEERIQRKGSLSFFSSLLQVKKRSQ